MASKEGPIKVEMDQANVHKNSISFEQVLQSDLDEELLGKQYIPKSTLRLIGWKPGNRLGVTLEVIDD